MPRIAVTTPMRHNTFPMVANLAPLRLLIVKGRRSGTRPILYRSYVAYLDIRVSGTYLASRDGSQAVSIKLVASTLFSSPANDLSLAYTVS